MKRLSRRKLSCGYSFSLFQGYTDPDLFVFCVDDSHRNSQAEGYLHRKDLMKIHRALIKVLKHQKHVRHELHYNFFSAYPVSGGHGIWVTYAGRAYRIGPKRDIKILADAFRVAHKRLERW